MAHAAWRVLLELAPWMLLGMAIAGTLHAALPRDFFRRHLRGRGGVVKAVAIGVPLPLCSCGVIPTGLGLKRDGASDGATVAFLISTPQTGVDSILVSASMLGWPFALFKVGSATLTGLVGGWLTDAFGPGTPAPLRAHDTEDEPAHRPGAREGLRHALLILRGIWGWLVLGIVVSAAIETLLPPDALSRLAGNGALLPQLVALLVAVPLYVCATASVPIAAALVGSGLPPGAALVFLMAGPATNVATIGAIYRSLGRRVTAIYLATIVAGSLGLAWVFDFVLTASPGSGAHRHHDSPGFWTVASAVVLLALLAAFAFDDLRHWVARRTWRRAAPSIEVAVRGMSCQSCVTKLERALREADGVASVEVTLEPGVARVRGSIDERRVREIVEQAGFSPAAAGTR